jgi:outer membrane protein TolC
MNVSMNVFYRVSFGLSLSLISFALAYATTSVPFFDAVTRMVTNSPKYRAAIQNIEGDKAAAAPGLYSHLPEASAEISHGNSGVFSNDGETVKSTLLTGSLSLPLFRFGADTANVKIAKISRAQADIAAIFALAQAEKEMALLAVENIKLEKSISLEDRIFRSRVELFNKADALFKRGLLPAEELDKMRFDVGVAKLQLAEARVRATEIKQQVSVALGDGIISQEWPWGARFFDRFEKWDFAVAVQKFLPLATENERLDVQKSAERLSTARAGALPSVGLNASMGKQYSSLNGSRDNPMNWSMSVSASVPLFSRMQTFSNVEAASRALSAASLKVQDAERSLQNEVRGTAATLAELVVASRERAIFLQQANKNLSRARERFLAGKISSNELAQDETKVFQMEQSLLDNEALLHGSLIRLCSAFVMTLQYCVQRL